ncbi:MAG: hypothetical protein ACI9C1_002843 [Candidatus Aldehydirespiratoraceae bacterium]|jgi:hypothetical protein
MSASTTSRAGTPTATESHIAALLDHCVDVAADDPPGAVAAVVELVAVSRDLDVALLLDGVPVAAHAVVRQYGAPDELLLNMGPWLPGLVRERLLSADRRHRTGVHHTSLDMAETIVSFVAELRPFDLSDTILDPSCGGGAFLLAAAEALPGDPSRRVAQLRGVDLDPLAVATTVASLRLWSGGAAVDPGSFVVADGLAPDLPIDQPTVVLGNPPFLSQLRGDTVRDTASRENLRLRWPDVGGYVDDAAAFLLASVELVADGGVVALVQPASFLAARDGEPVRRRLQASAPPSGIWIDRDRQFEAAVDTIALVLDVGGAGGPIRRSTGVPRTRLAMADAPATAASWAALLRDDSRPMIDASQDGVLLSDVATVTAGFRDQFYGLRGAVSDEPGSYRLITSGLIDPLRDRWGVQPCRFDGDRWEQPTVDLDLVASGIRAWIDARLVPKLLVASQTKTIEVMIDEQGECVPCTPVVTVEPNADAPSLPHLAAVLTSPVVSLRMLDAAAGTALSRDAMRVSASTLGAIVLPEPSANWDKAAEIVRASAAGVDANDLWEVGRLMTLAYGVTDVEPIHKWWRERLPRR